MVKRACGGCEGKGSHWRWCPVAVGPHAWLFGTLSQQAENLADTIGGNDPVAANHCYAAAGLLKERAVAAREYWREHQTDVDTGL